MKPTTSKQRLAGATRAERSFLARCDAFWTWFHHLNLSPDSRIISAIAQEVDQKVEAIEVGLRWEIGPLDDHDSYLAFGLSGDISLWDRNQLIVSRARLGARAEGSPGWQFLPSKPPKRWNRLLRLDDEVVDFRSWQLARRDRYVEFYVPPGSMVPGSYSSPNERRGLCWLFLEHELGEECALRRVDNVFEVDRPLLSIDEFLAAMTDD